jgi:hypothetical protein
MAQRSRLVAMAVSALVSATAISHADEPATLDQLITSYLTSRDASVQLAPDGQLTRRYALDVTGVVPSSADLDFCEGKTPAAMFDYFASKGAMPHTTGEPPWVWTNLLKDADHFLLSNSSQFSQVGHLREATDQLRRLYVEGYSYQELTRWFLKSQVFLNRFPSAADRANAAFFLFLGRDSLASEVPMGNMWNGYQLLDPDIPASDAETEPNYHVHAFDPAICASGTMVCEATLWTETGSTPDEAIELLVTSPMFAEATVDRYWERVMGTALPGVEFPELRKLLVEGFVASGYDVGWLLREVMTSAAYTQEMMYR